MKYYFTCYGPFFFCILFFFSGCDNNAEDLLRAYAPNVPLSETVRYDFIGFSINNDQVENHDYCYNYNFLTINDSNEIDFSFFKSNEDDENDSQNVVTPPSPPGTTSGNCGRSSTSKFSLTSSASSNSPSEFRLTSSNFSENISDQYIFNFINCRVYTLNNILHVEYIFLEDKYVLQYIIEENF